MDSESSTTNSPNPRSSQSKNKNKKGKKKKKWSKTDTVAIIPTDLIFKPQNNKKPTIHSVLYLS